MEQIRRVMRPTDVPDTGELITASTCLVIELIGQAFSATSSGRIPTRTLQAGQRMTEVYRSLSARMSFRGSCRSTIWT